MSESKPEKKLLTSNPEPQRNKEQVDSRPKSDPKKRLITSNPDKKVGKDILSD